MHTLWASGEQDTVTNVLKRAAESHPGKVFLDFVGDTYTYSEVERLSDQLAAGLSDLGVQPGDTIASFLDNNLEAVLSWFAINKVGAISVPLNTALKGDFLRHQVDDSGAKIVIAETDYAERISALGPELPNVKNLITRGGSAVKASGMAALTMAEVMKDAGDFVAHATRPGDLTMLIYTSGTTGSSKGCMISHNYACNLARQAAKLTGSSEHDVIWTALPLFHLNATATSVLRTAMQCATCAIYPRFSLSGFWTDIERSGATMVSLLGSMPPLIAKAPDCDEMKRCFGQIRTITTVPFPDELREIWKNRFGVEQAACGLYGLSEAAMVVYNSVDVPAPPGSSGRRNDDFEVIIVDENYKEVPPGAKGEVLIRPKRPHVMFEGYWNRPEETLKVFKNMWLHSGDMGMFDEDGFFYFIDRKKDYLRRRGENISSQEMESTFLKHPAIKDVAVHAVFSPLGEDDVKVTAVLTEGASLAPEQLCKWCLDKVPYYAVPRYIEFRDDLPRNPTGKILKFQLREEGCTPYTWDLEASDIVIQKR